jgi:hypothetical protein
MNQAFNIEEAMKEIAQIDAEFKSGVRKVPTLESLKTQLDNGEIDQAEHDREIDRWELTPESTERRVKEVRSKMRIVL